MKRVSVSSKMDTNIRDMRSGVDCSDRLRTLPFMIERLALRRITANQNTEPFSHILREQHIVKVVRSGTFEIVRQLSSTHYSYASGELILPQRDAEKRVCWTSDISVLMIALPESAMQAVARETGTDSIEIKATPHFHDKRVEALIEALEFEEAGGFLCGGLYLDAIAQSLASVITQTHGVLRRPLHTYSSGLSPAQLNRVVEYVRAHMSGDLSIAKLATVAGLSPAYFSHMFQRATGRSPHHFVLEMRIERARDLLRTSNARMIEIAIECGFESPQHFARVFRKLTRSTPSEYRLNYRPSAL